MSEANPVIGYIVQGRNGALGLVLPKPELQDAPTKGILMGTPAATLFETEVEAQAAIDRTNAYTTLKEFFRWNSKENRTKPISEAPAAETVECAGCKLEVKKSECSEFYGVYVCHDCVPE
jgi:hypothetical protein